MEKPGVTGGTIEVTLPMSQPEIILTYQEDALGVTTRYDPNLVRDGRSFANHGATDEATPQVKIGCRCGHRSTTVHYCYCSVILTYAPLSVNCRRLYNACTSEPIGGTALIEETPSESALQHPPVL